MFDERLQERKGFHEMQIHCHMRERPSRKGEIRRALDALQRDVNLLSPKVYESGLLLSLDPRLVNLYGEMPLAPRDVVIASW